MFFDNAFPNYASVIARQLAKYVSRTDVRKRNIRSSSFLSLSLKQLVNTVSAL